MKACLQCLEEFEGRSNKLYCSDACKMQAFQQRHEGELADLSSETNLFSSKNRQDKSSSKNYKLSPKEIELKKHEMDLEHQRKLLEFDQKQKEFVIREKELELLRNKNDEEIILTNGRREKELKLKQLAVANKKAFAPIKTATYDILTQVIDNGKDAVWTIEEIEELVDDIEDTKDKLKVYFITKPTSFTDSIIYIMLDDLKQELEDSLNDESCFENDEELIIDFKRSYIRELQTVLRELENGLENE